VPACKEEPADHRCSIILLAPLTGTQAAIGLQVDRAKTLVEDDLRADVNNTVVIREIDTSSNPAIASADVNRALDRWDAPIIVGSVLSTETRAFLKGVLNRGVVVLANGSSDPTIRSLPFRRQGDGFFRNWPADDSEGRAMAEYLSGSSRAKHLAVFYANDAYARALANAFVKRFQELGGTISGPVVYETTTMSFEPILRLISDNSIDGYYIVGLPPDLAGMYNAVRRSPRGATMPIYTAVAAETSEFKSLIKFSLDNLFYTAPSVDQSSSAFFHFKEAYSRRFGGEPPDVVAGVTYDALRIAVDALKKNGCDRTRVRQYLYKMPPFDGATGPTGFDDLGDVVTKPVAIRYYDRGQSRLALITARDR
jgi:branched-chain amino acid transport system substrate-binding protein